MSTTCCKNDLGSLPHNEGVDIGVVATQTGVYTAILFFAGIRIKRNFNLTIGDDIVIPAPFNELYYYKVQVEQPDGTLVKLLDCENFVFKTYISADETCGDQDCDPEETLIYE